MDYHQGGLSTNKPVRMYSPTVSLPLILPRANVSAELEELKIKETYLLKQKTQLEQKLGERKAILEKMQIEAGELKDKLKNLKEPISLDSDFFSGTKCR